MIRYLLHHGREYYGFEQWQWDYEVSSWLNIIQWEEPIKFLLKLKNGQRSIWKKTMEEKEYHI